MLCFDDNKRTSRVKNTPVDIAEYYRKTDVSENSKVYYGRFLRNGFHERQLTR